MRVPKSPKPPKHPKAPKPPKPEELGELKPPGLFEGGVEETGLTKAEVVGTPQTVEESEEVTVPQRTGILGDPGDRVEVSGVYVQWNGLGGSLERRATCTAGEPFPPTDEEGFYWQLEERTTKPPLDEVEPVEAFDEVDPLEGRTTRELQEIASCLGLNPYAYATHGALLTDLRNSPKAVILAASQDLRGKRSKKPTSWLLQTSDGIVAAVDPDGWYSASVRPDGSAVITCFAPPNALNREHSLSMEGDRTFEVASLKGFIDRLEDLLTLATKSLKDAT